jgi:hypothetical protein
MPQPTSKQPRAFNNITVIIKEMEDIVQRDPQVIVEGPMAATFLAMLQSQMSGVNDSGGLKQYVEHQENKVERKEPVSSSRLMEIGNECVNYGKRICAVAAKAAKQTA